LDHGEVQSIGPAKHVCEEYLAKRYGASHSTIPSQVEEVPLPNSGKCSLSKHDARIDFINHSNLRNDIEVLDLSSERHGFGNGGATITEAKLTDLEGRPLSWVVGGEMVRLEITAQVIVNCTNIIVGFHFKDRLGQVLFSQNSFLASCLNPVSANPNETIKGVFTFRLPILPRGSYSVDVAIADGPSPESVVQLQWVHDVFSLESRTSSIVSGLVGLVFDSIELSSQGASASKAAAA